MTHYNICMKSGTGGWFDAENKDLVLLRDVSAAIPRVAEILAIYDRQTKQTMDYIVTEVKYTYIPNGFSSSASCSATVYCIPIKKSETTL